MDEERISLANWHISDAKRLLQGLIISWESFDYVAAQNVVKELEAKLRLLNQLEAEAETQTTPLHPCGEIEASTLEVTAIVEPFQNARGFSLRVLKAGRPRC